MGTTHPRCSLIFQKNRILETGHCSYIYFRLIKEFVLWVNLQKLEFWQSYLMSRIDWQLKIVQLNCTSCKQRQWCWWLFYRLKCLLYCLTIWPQFEIKCSVEWMSWEKLSLFLYEEYYFHCIWGLIYHLPNVIL